MLRKHFSIPSVDFSSSFHFKFWAVFFPIFEMSPASLKAVIDTTSPKEMVRLPCGVFEVNRDRCFHVNQAFSALFT